MVANFPRLYMVGDPSRNQFVRVTGGAHFRSCDYRLGSMAASSSITSHLLWACQSARWWLDRQTEICQLLTVHPHPEVPLFKLGYFVRPWTFIFDDDVGQAILDELWTPIQNRGFIDIWGSVRYFTERNNSEAERLSLSGKSEQMTVDHLDIGLEADA